MHKLITFSKNTVIGILALLLFANVTFAHSLDYHLCQGELQSVAFFGQKATCSKMMEAEMSTSLSCCDAKKAVKGFVFKQKSCCDNIQLIQDNVFQKPSVDIEKTSSTSFNFINDFEALSVNQKRTSQVIEKVEIPPPPNISHEHSQENLQVFII